MNRGGPADSNKWERAVFAAGALSVRHRPVAALDPERVP